MVYNKRDSKGQETNGNHDVRDHTASNRDYIPRDHKSGFYLKHGYNEDIDALKKTDFWKHNSSVNGRKLKEEDRG
jgi:hypothetical protein